MGHCEYINDNLFGNPEDIQYEDGTVSIRGELIRVNLFDVNDSEAIRTRIVEPVLVLYREGGHDRGGFVNSVKWMRACYDRNMVPRN